MPALRKFGIELELQAPQAAARGAHDTQRLVQEFAAETVRAAGVEIRVNTHFGRDYHMWQAKDDGSLSPRGWCCEVVSRIMPAAESSYDEIRRAVTALDTAGFGVNRTCGFHVHLNVADLPTHVRQLIILRYAQLQADINRMVPVSRRNNTYCPALRDSDRRHLIDAVDNGRPTFPAADHFAAASMQWIMASGQGARIEFRQAAATCNAAKVIGWVKFLQEMVEEVARRAALTTFGTVAAPLPTPRPVLTPRLVGGQVPHMRNGSDQDRALTQLCTHGVLTVQWAIANGIADNVLRRIVTGWRRHGAGLITSRHDNGVAYVLAGSHALPVRREQVFADAVVQPVIEAPLSDHHKAIAWWIARDAAGDAAGAAAAARAVARDAAWDAARAAAWAAAGDAARAMARAAAWDAARAAAGDAARAAAGDADQRSPQAIGQAAWTAAWDAAQASVRQIVGAAPPVPIAAPQPARTRAADFVAYPFEAGLSADTLAWCADRRDTFASSDEPSSVVRAA